MSSVLGEAVIKDNPQSMIGRARRMWRNTPLIAKVFLLVIAVGAGRIAYLSMKTTTIGPPVYDYLNAFSSAVGVYEHYQEQPIRSGLKDDSYMFSLNGKVITLLSGAIHYFRVVPEYWEDRLLKLKAAGANTVETYMPWNMHEEVRGQFRSDSILDIRRFLQTAQKVGLLAIVRPGPYICAEWDLGGLPHWLLRDPEMKVRTVYKPYMEAADNYLTWVFHLLDDLQFQKGGPIIAFQVENEYAGYKKDPNYMREMTKLFQKHNVKELLFTSDGEPDPNNIGNVPGILRTVNGQKNIVGKVKQLRKEQEDKPAMVMEFWTGWFDQWGSDERHNTHNLDKFTDSLQETLTYSASVNLYMFHGGTNFGWYNGAVGHWGGRLPRYKPIITSYDYDAPLDEAGDKTAKYYHVQSIWLKWGNPGGPKLEAWPGGAGVNGGDAGADDLPPNSVKEHYASVEISHYMSLDDVIKHVRPETHEGQPRPMELLDYNGGSGQHGGFLLYVKEDLVPGKALTFKGQVADRAQLRLNEVWSPRVVDYTKEDARIDVTLEFARNSLWVLVENLGRLNFGTGFGGDVELDRQRKGLLHPVLLDGEPLTGWSHFPLDFKPEFLAQLRQKPWKNYNRDVAQGPALFRATLNIPGEPRDSFIKTDGWTKGVIFVNGFNLGRYWSVGPQSTLYLPGPLLKTGANEIVFFELHECRGGIEFSDRPSLGKIVSVEH